MTAENAEATEAPEVEEQDGTEEATDDETGADE